MDNLEAINQFMKEKLVNGQSRTTIRHQRVMLNELAVYIQKPFIEANQEDINDFIIHKKETCSNSTIKIWKVVFKNFFRHLYGLEKGEYPQSVKHLKLTNSRKSLPIKPKDVITREDVAKLVKLCKCYRDEAIVTTLYESGARLGEFVGLNIDDLTFDSRGVVLTVAGKTGERRLRLIESVPFLQKYIENHPTGKGALWCILVTPHTRVKNISIQHLLRKLKKISGIQKPMNPHAFRHSRITELAKYLSDAKLKIFSGWIASSSMSSIYVHISGKDLDDDLLKIAGVEVKEEKHVSPLQKVECPRCHRKNAFNSTFCNLCGLVLSEKEALKELERQQEIDELKERVEKTEGVEHYIEKLYKQMELMKEEINQLKVK